MFNTDTLTPAMLGRLNKHLDKLVRVNGVVMTFRECYSRPEYTHKRIGRHWNDSAETMVPTYVLWREDGTGTDVPKLVFDTIQLPDVTDGTVAA